MKYLSVKEVAKIKNMSERTIRNHCATGKINGAYLTGKTWNIPESYLVEENIATNNNFSSPLLDALRKEKEAKLKGGIYHKTQIMLTYNSNHIEGSKLTEEQTRYIYETNTIGVTEAVNVDDIIETTNHFKCIDMVIDCATLPISEKLIKDLHLTLKSGTHDSTLSWFKVGDYKSLPNEVGGNETTKPQDVAKVIQNLITKYNKIPHKTIEDIIAFHKEFESIHPFQDGNGRVGRLIMFKECLANNIVPFIIRDELKHFYYRGLREWENERGYLIDTCLTAQDEYKNFLDYFEIEY